jgi:hypothetical protein
VLLKWKPAQVEEGDYFIVQQSADAKVYREIGNVSAMVGNTEFDYVDKTPTAGVSYYRIVQVSKAGRTAIYPVVRIKAAVEQTTFKILSTGMQQQPLLEISANKALEGTVTIFDMNGKQMSANKIAIDKGMYRSILQMPAGTAGTYMAVFVSQAGEVFTSKFIY